MGDSYISVISIPVSNPDVARDFYVNVLGFEVVRDDSDVRLRWVMLRPPGAQTGITLVTWFETMAAGSLKGTVLSVPDIEAAASDLRAKGALDDSAEIATAPWGRWIQVDDPDGNGWVIQQSAGEETP